jgi:hypothetical protein
MKLKEWNVADSYIINNKVCTDTALMPYVRLNKQAVVYDFVMRFQ